MDDMIVHANSSNGIAWPTIEGAFKSSGWTAHAFPNIPPYYYNARMRVTTDVDLRSKAKLESITQYLNSKDSHGPVLPPPGWEMFLRDSGKHQYEFSPVKGFVNHNERILTFDPEQMDDAGALSEDDSGCSLFMMDTPC